MEKHSRPPAFEGSDGQPYTVAIWVDSEPASDGSYGAALLFVRWTSDGSKPEGHLETPCLVRAESAEDARGVLREMTLHHVKRYLDSLVEARAELPNW